MTPTHLLAADAGEIAVMIPIISVFIIGLIIIAKIITKHQREMAELIHKEQQQPGLIDEIRAMRSEMADLKDRVNQQTIAIESNSSSVEARTSPPDVPTRLSE